MPSGSGGCDGVGAGVSVGEGETAGEGVATTLVDGGTDAATCGFLMPPVRKKAASKAAAATVASDAVQASRPPGRRHHGAPNRPESIPVRTRGPRSLGTAFT